MEYNFSKAICDSAFEEGSDIRMQDLDSLQRRLERDDIEDVLVTICENNENYLEIIKKDLEENGELLEKLITKIIQERKPLIDYITFMLARLYLDLFANNENSK